MDILVRVAMGEQESLELLKAMARINARLLVGNPSLPLLYDSGVVYRLEDVETWSDVIRTLAEGHEDCDSLATWRAGELLARGWEALRPGDPGWELAFDRKLESIEAEPVLRTRAPVGESGLYHVVTAYLIDGVTFYDDPSARLGMRRNLIDPTILQRWNERGVRPLAQPKGIF